MSRVFLHTEFPDEGGSSFRSAWLNVSYCLGARDWLYVAGLGVPVTQIDTSQLTPQQVDGQIAGALAARRASLSEHG